MLYMIVLKQSPYPENGDSMTLWNRGLQPMAPNQIQNRL
jgi:hypothetical protein